MSIETAFLTALGLTLLLSLLILLYLQRPLHRILCDLCGKEDRARFWTAYSNVVIVLVPLAAVMLGRAAERPGETSILLVADHLKWAILGLIMAVFLIAMGVAAFILPASSRMVIDATQADELQRLLTKVEHMRAREIVDRASSSSSQPV